MLKVSEITDFSEFEGLKDTWNQVLQKSIDNDVFSTWEWLWCWWRTYGKDRQLKILVAEEDDEIIAFAPLMVSQYRCLRLGTFRKLEFIGSPNADYNNFILLKKENECLQLFMSHLSEDSDWDLLELRDVREGSASAKILQTAINNRAPKMSMMVNNICPYIDLPASMDEFMTTLSANMRRNIRKKMRKLRKDHKVDFKSYRDFSSIEDAMETFFDLHQRRWTSTGGTGVFASADFRAFHLKVAEAFSRTEWLGLNFLTADDEPISAEYSFDYDSKTYGYLTGFNPDYGRYSTGTLSKMCAIEQSIQKGFREYDFARGSESYKAHWTKTFRQNVVTRMAYRGWLAKLYGWCMHTGFFQPVINKLGLHLSN